jgi:hypothetical protein
VSDLTTLTPAQIDGFLAENWRDRQTTAYHLASDRKALDRWPDDKGLLDAIARTEAKLARLAAEGAPYEAEFSRRGGWNRYFLVTNSNGHVHRGMNCSTCYPTTEYAWLPELSDCDEAAMVDEFGEKACTVCFPNAPTLPAFHGPGRRDRAAQEARAAEKAGKAAEKAAKAITNPDGSELRVDGWPIKTKIAAQRALSGAVQNLGWYGSDHPSDFINQAAVLTNALNVAGIDVVPIIKRAAKKVASEGGHHDALRILTLELGLP